MEFIEAELQPSCSEQAYKINCTDEEMKVIAKKMIDFWKKYRVDKIENDEAEDKDSRDTKVWLQDVKIAINKTKRHISRHGANGTVFAHTCNYETEFVKREDGSWKVRTCNNDSSAWDNWEYWMTTKGVSWENAEYYDNEEDEEDD